MVTAQRYPQSLTPHPTPPPTDDSSSEESDEEETVGLLGKKRKNTEEVETPAKKARQDPATQNGEEGVLCYSIAGNFRGFR